MALLDKRKSRAENSETEFVIWNWKIINICELSLQFRWENEKN